jgi:hypothetical protein
VTFNEDLENGRKLILILNGKNNWSTYKIRGS